MYSHHPGGDESPLRGPPRPDSAADTLATTVTPSPSPPSFDEQQQQPQQQQTAFQQGTSPASPHHPASRSAPGEYLGLFDAGWKLATDGTPNPTAPNGKRGQYDEATLQQVSVVGNTADSATKGGEKMTAGMFLPPLESPHSESDAGSFIVPNTGNDTDADTEVDEGIPDFDDIFADLSLKFGFQDGIIQNVREYFTAQITSRAARLNVSNAKAIRSLHNDYISGRHANYRKWALSDLVRGSMGSGYHGEASLEDHEAAGLTGTLAREQGVKQAERLWRRKYRHMSLWDKTHQLALYLCLVNEAGNLRLVPELMNFLFKTADDYCESDLPEGVRLAPKGAYLNDIIKPLYRFHRSQLYRIPEPQGVPLKLVRREADHARTVGYDDINETFWDLATMRRIVLKNGQGRLLDVPPHQRWEQLKNVDWERSLKKTYFERRTFMNHLLVNFSRIWMLLFGSFYCFIMSVLVPSMWKYRHANASDSDVPSTLRWTLISGGGAVAALLGCLASLSEWFYIPRTPRNLGIILQRALIYFIAFVVCIAPMVHLKFFEHESLRSKILTSISVIVNICVLVMSVVVAPADLCRNKVYNPIFTATFSSMQRKQRAVSVGLWVLLFVSKFLESYAVIFLPVREAVDAIYGLDVGTCHGGVPFLCRMLKWTTLGVFIFLLGMFYFLDTYVWWLVWTAVLQFSMSSFRVFKLIQWEQLFPTLPDKVFPRLFAVKHLPVTANPRSMFAQMWNAVIDSLKEDHHLNAEQTEKLKFTEVDVPKVVQQQMLSRSSIMPPVGMGSTAGSVINMTPSVAPVTGAEMARTASYSSMNLAEQVAVAADGSPAVRRGSLGGSSIHSSGNGIPAGATDSAGVRRSTVLSLEGGMGPMSWNGGPPSTIMAPASLPPAQLYAGSTMGSGVAGSHASVLPFFGGGASSEGKVFTDPPYLVQLKNGATKIKFFPNDSEAERRLKFLAHTLDMAFPEPARIENMPSFSVLIPHYNEKIIMSFEEITHRDGNSAYSILKYLQALHPAEWANFVEEAKEYLPDETDPEAAQTRTFMSAVSNMEVDPDVPASFPKELVLKARIWASRRSQSLFRTVSGHHKYHEALSLLYALENADELARFSPENRQREINRVVSEKFRIVVSMQRYAEFTEQEKDDSRIMLSMYPGVNIVYPQRVKGEDGIERVFSHLIDGYCDLDEHGEFVPRISVELPGWPILGDGKGCNQNHGVFFCRGEFMEAIDANQDHYLEECLKVRSLLAEFNSDPKESPVGLVGLREHIFSHGIGAVADMSATTETTLVSLNQPILNKLGARMHYGHPDFWNLCYAIPRGGVSKAQRGLHLNEDIYAGMMVFMRGGVNKHAEYMQVGKGKDLGINSVMGYFSKLAMGMSEQILSREQYRIGTGLPLDRCLTFFFANPGFVISNVLAMVSLQTFILFLVCIAALSNNLTPCPQWDKLGDGKYNETQVKLFPAPQNCATLTPVYDWEKQIVLTFLPVFFVILIPVLMHTALERGAASILRYMRQLASISVVFSIFSTQIWARSFLNTAAYGQAKHVVTGRAMEVVRRPFTFLFTNYKELALAIGLLLLGGLLYATCSVGANASLIFFWVSVPPLVVAPFFYNPHQFRFRDFVLDYLDTLLWFGRGARQSDDPKKDSWIAYHRRLRAQITGHRRPPKGKKAMSDHRRRAGFTTIWWREIVIPFLLAVGAALVYAVGSSGGWRKLAIVGAAGFAPIILNGVFLGVLGVVTLVLGPFLGLVTGDGLGPLAANLARTWSILVFVLVLCGSWAVSGWTFSSALLGLMCFALVHRAYVRIIVVLLPREMDTNEANLAWWDGRWWRLGGARMLYVPVREFFCKTLEMCAWPMDLFQAHLILFLLFPATLIKYIDDWHSLLVMWAFTRFDDMPLTKQERARRRRRMAFSLFVFLSLMVLFLVLLFGPLVYPLPKIKYFQEWFIARSNSPNPVEQPRIGFIGLGQMGYPMASNLRHKTAPNSPTFTVYDHVPAVSSRFVAEHPGAATAATPAALAASSDVVVTMLPAGAHVRSVYLEPSTGILAGLAGRPAKSVLLVDSSTIDVGTAKAVAAAARADGAGVVIDAPVSGGTLGAAAATLTFMVGAPSKEIFEIAREGVLVHMGKNIVHCGEEGNGQVAKICNNMLLGISMIAASETMNLGVRLGMDPKLLASILNTSSGRCWSTDTYNPCPGVLPNVPSSRDYEGGFGNPLMAKDLGLAVSAATEVKATVALGALANQIYLQLASTPGFEGKDFSSVYKWLNDNAVRLEKAAAGKK
ncbi:1,3-beta-D-glucan synthase [Phlyctochytrium bullatum]|nr:1,3-beta-D-glucan synthase [Phlyctochytrium bullatum]